MTMFTRRSLKRALFDTGRLVEELRIQKSEVVSISIDSWGDARVHLEAKGFVRIFRGLRVNLDSLRTSVDSKGNLHAEFDKKQTCFTTMISPNTAEMDAITGKPVAMIELACHPPIEALSE